MTAEDVAIGTIIYKGNAATPYVITFVHNGQFLMRRGTVYAGGHFGNKWQSIDIFTVEA
jgi:hypothetical protein